MTSDKVGHRLVGTASLHRIVRCVVALALDARKHALLPHNWRRWLETTQDSISVLLAPHVERSAFGEFARRKRADRQRRESRQQIPAIRGQIVL